MPNQFTHHAHPTDTRKTMGGYYRTACGRWAGITAFFASPRAIPCPKCAAEMLLRDITTTTTN